MDDSEVHLHGIFLSPFKHGWTRGKLLGVSFMVWVKFHDTYQEKGGEEVKMLRDILEFGCVNLCQYV